MPYAQFNKTPIDQLMNLDESGPDPFQEMSPEPQGMNMSKFIRGDVKSNFLSGANAGGAPMHYDGSMASSMLPPHPAMVAQQAPMPDLVVTCPMIFEHIKNCPICSKFYNSDKTMYVIAIVLLSIVCIILLKRVLEK